MTDKMQKFLDSMPNDGSMEFYDNASFCGICIKWSEKGRGFGEYTFSVDKKTGEFNLDNERDSPGAVQAVIHRIIDENPVELKKLFLDMITKAHVDDPRWPYGQFKKTESEG